MQAPFPRGCFTWRTLGINMPQWKGGQHRLHFLLRAGPSRCPAGTAPARKWRLPRFPISTPPWSCSGRNAPGRAARVWCFSHPRTRPQPSKGAAGSPQPTRHQEIRLRTQEARQLKLPGSRIHSKSPASKLHLALGSLQPWRKIRQIP